jgi:hypothetical protein
MTTTETAEHVVRFFTRTLETGLDCGLVTHDDVLRHATPELLALHLPKPLLAKLLTVCLASPRMDAKLVVDVLGVRELSTHIPGHVIWACLAEAAQRALGGIAVPVSIGFDRAAESRPMPAVPVAVTSTPSAPTATAMTAAGSNHAPGATASATAIPSPAEPPPLGAPPVGPKLGRSTQTIPTIKPVTTAPVARAQTAPIGSIGTGINPASARPALTTPNTVRRPQAAGATPAAPSPSALGTPPGGTGGMPAPRARTTPPSARRASTGSDFDIDTDVGANAAGGNAAASVPPAAPEWKGRTDAEAIDALGVSDDDIVDWQAEETVTAGVDLERKR